jgi:hypothetical protein
MIVVDKTDSKDYVTEKFITHAACPRPIDF